MSAREWSIEFADMIEDLNAELLDRVSIEEDATQRSVQYQTIDSLERLVLRLRALAVKS